MRRKDLIYLIGVITYFAGSTLAVCPVSCPLCPCFTQGPYTFNVSEDTPIGTTIATLIATPGSSIVYSSDSQTFLIDATTGVLTLGSSLDYEMLTNYEFRVEAQDGASRDLEGRGHVTINVLNVNEFSPSCSSNLVYFSVLENQHGVSFQLPNCTDNDFTSNPVFGYQLTGYHDAFKVNSSGHLILLQPLNFEITNKYVFNVVVNDSVIPTEALNATIRVIVVVQPQNEFDPLFTTNTYSFEVPENVSIGSIIGNVTASDDDSGNDGIVYYFISSGEADAFAVDEQTGDVFLVIELDFETVSSYSFFIAASDSSTDISSRRSSTTSITINVLDANDNLPSFFSPVYYITVPENAEPHTPLTNLKCFDLDTGVNKELTYSIYSGNDEGLFHMDSLSGNVSLVSALNYDNPQSSDFIALTIQCREIAVPERVSSTLLLISITGYNTFSPQPTHIEFEASVSEDMLPGTLITTVIARDRDRGIEGILHYYIIDNFQQHPSCLRNKIAIDENTGNVYLISQIDYEKDIKEIVCLVTIWDSGSPQRANLADLIISVTNINDNQPQCFPLISVTHVRENSSIGDIVYALSCNDTDSASLQYSIIEPPMLPFTVDSTGNLIIQSVLDYETQTSYSFTVLVSDGLFTVNKSIVIIVDPVNEFSPAFSQTLYNCSLYENMPIGSSIPCNILATDADNGVDGEIGYRLGSSDSFELTIRNELILLADIDRESCEDYLLEIEVYDKGSPSLSSTATINITILDRNDNYPQMPPLIFGSISEKSLAGTVVTTVECSDLDQNLNGETNIQVGNIFQLSSNYFENITHNRLFDMNSSDGNIVVSGNVDFETSSLYKIEILCSDNGLPSLTSSSTLLITVQHENEYSPIINNPETNLSVSEDTSIGTVLSKVTATDQDSGEDGIMKFSLSPSLHFDINENSGEIYLSRQLDCEESIEHSFTVTAKDCGIPVKFSQIRIIVNVTECHLGTLVPEYNFYSMSVIENTAPGEMVGSVSCLSTRVNISVGVLPMYQLISGSSNFWIDQRNGEIQVINSPDFEWQTLYKNVVECYDPNHPRITNSFIVFISVLPLNEFTPQFSQNNITVSVLENTPLGTSILHLEASDQDLGLDGNLKFFIAAPDSSKVIVNQESGQVYLTTSLDRETEETIIFTAYVEDLSQEEAVRRTASVTVTVIVDDVNDNWPRCGQQVHHIVVSPHEIAPSRLVDSFHCTDDDINENSQLEYQMQSNSQLFEVRADSLYLSNNLNISGPPQFYIPISVRDNGTPFLSSNILVIIEVQEPNELNIDSNEYAALVEAEGLRNSVQIHLKDLSLALWETVKEKLKQAISTSVTHYCALFPEACSLASGCSEFHGMRHKKSLPDNYVTFGQPSVAVLTDTITSSVNSDGSIFLTIPFYVMLPSDSSKSPNRQTNYVIPGATLNLVVEEDGQTIGAIVRDSVAQQRFSLQERMIIVASVCSILGTILVVVFITLVHQIIKKKLKSNKIVPIRKTLQSLSGDTATRMGSSNLQSKRGSIASDDHEVSRSSTRATCDGRNKPWSIARIARIIKRKNSESSSTGISETTSKKESRSSSAASTEGVCSGYRQSYQVPGKFFASTADNKDDDIPEIFLPEESQSNRQT